MKTIHDAKQELKSYMHLLKYIEEENENICQLYGRLTNGTSILSSMPKNEMDPKKFESDMAELVDMQNRHSENVVKFEKLKLSIGDKINTLSEPFRSVLYFKYLKGFSLVKISILLNYHYNHICRVHAQAVKKYQIIRSPSL